jgi:glycosyltransferase involved in cell wall biosynthesis
MRLGFILDPGKSNSNYRVSLPMRALAGRGHTVVRLDDLEADTPLPMLMECDLVHCFRRHDRAEDLRQLSRGGVAVSFDNDDDLGSSDTLTGKSSLQGLRTNRRLSAIYAEVARFADLVTTPSARIADIYREKGAEHVEVIENYIDGEDIRPRRASPHEGVVVGWVAGLEHAADLPGLRLVEIVSRLLEIHPTLRVLTVGVRLPLRSDRYEHIKEVPHSELFKIAARIDIGIAPLMDTPFNRSRSNVKPKEYAAGGAAWIASAVGPYRGLGEEHGGMVIDNDGWFDALDLLVRSPRARKRLSRRARRWAKSQTVDRHATTWEKAFEGAIERSSERLSRPTAARASLA